MARLITSGGEIRDHPTVDINSPDGITAGTVATATDLTNERSGQACFMCAGTAASTSFRQWAFTAPALGGQVFPRAYFNIVDALPSATAKIAALTTAAGGALISARLSAAGTLELWNDAAGTQIGTDTNMVVAPGVWYGIQLRLLINTGAVDQAEMLVIDDHPDTPWESISGTALTISDTHAARFRSGWVDAPGVASTMLVDDVAVNDSTGTAQNNFPGGGRVYVVSPMVVPSAASWTNCAGGTVAAATFSDYVDNLPPLGVADHSTAGHAGATAHQCRETVNGPNPFQAVGGWARAGMPFPYDTSGTATATGTAVIWFGDNAARMRRAQSFRVSGELLLESLWPGALRVGTPTDNLVVQIMSDNGGLPSETVLATATYPGASLGTTVTSAERMKYAYLDNPLPLQRDTPYWIVLSRSGPMDATNYYLETKIATDLGGEDPAVFDGANWIKSGTNWSTLDHGFKLNFSQPRPPLRLVSGLACHAQATTGTKAGTIVLSAPAAPTTSFNYGNGGAVGGTYPTGWWWTVGTPVYNPALTANSLSGPTGQVTKASVSGGVMLSFVGWQTEVGELTGGWNRYQKTADSTFWWGKRVDGGGPLLLETTDPANPVIVQSGDWAIYPEPQVVEGGDFPTTLVGVADGGGVPTGYTAV